jgi:oligoribonuclease NrnB/cAMP/cGMP phosphodiesterase (DHH superfamily)
MSQTLIVHHNDPDGWASAAITLKYVREQNIKQTIECIEMSYDKDPNLVLNKIDENTKVIMVDFSFKMDVMSIVSERANKLIWIDHHISAINDFKNFEDPNPNNGIIEFLLDDKKAACVLTWNYFYPNKLIPKTIELIGIYDSWKKDNSQWENALSTFYGSKCYEGFNDPQSEFWNRLVNGITYSSTEIIKAGQMARGYQDNLNIEIAKRTAFVTSLNIGRENKFFTAIACNSPLCNSMLFDSTNADEYDLMISYYQSNNKYFNISFYSKKPEVDCSWIAKHFGGGGHKGASGAQLTYLPFEVTDIKPEFRD